MEKLKRRIDGMNDNLVIYENEKNKLEKDLKKFGVKKADARSVDKLVKNVKKKLKSLGEEHDELEESIEESLERYEGNES